MRRWELFPCGKTSIFFAIFAAPVDVSIAYCLAVRLCKKWDDKSGGSAAVERPPFLGLASNARRNIVQKFTSNHRSWLVNWLTVSRVFKFKRSKVHLWKSMHDLGSLDQTPSKNFLLLTTTAPIIKIPVFFLLPPLTEQTAKWLKCFVDIINLPRLSPNKSASFWSH